VRQQCHDHRSAPREQLLTDETGILRSRLEITLEVLMIMQEELEALHEKVSAKTSELLRGSSKQREPNREPSEMPAHRGAAYWRVRAQKARALAEHMSHEKSRTRMLQVALDNDELADWAETHNGDDPVLTSLSA
jgi:hypothetical protein